MATYGEIARAAGSPKAFRATGQALRKNPNLISTPCHRVVFSDGRVGGYVGGKKKKTALLRGEGVVIFRDKIDLKKFGIKVSSRKFLRPEE